MDSKIVCEKCSKEFTKYYNLVRHKKSYCEFVKKEKRCEKCKKIFSCKSNLFRHLKICRANKDNHTNKDNKDNHSNKDNKLENETFTQLLKNFDILKSENKELFEF